MIKTPSEQALAELEAAVSTVEESPSGEEPTEEEFRKIIIDINWFEELKEKVPVD